MQIDGPRPDGAAARQGDPRLARTRQKRPQHPEARAHTAHHIVGRRRIDDIARGQMQRFALVRMPVGALAVHRRVHAMVAQDADEKADIREVRHIL